MQQQWIYFPKKYLTLWFDCNKFTAQIRLSKTGQVKYRLWRHPLKSTFIGPYDRGEAELYTGPRIVVIGAWEVHQLAGPS